MKTLVQPQDFGDECEYWQKVRDAVRPYFVRGYKCGRCGSCCDETDELLLKRKEEE